MLAEVFICPQITQIISSRNLWMDRFEGQLRVLPSIPTTDERSRFGPSRLSKFLRHPGAGSFVWSSTIRNEPGVLQ